MTFSCTYYRKNSKYQPIHVAYTCNIAMLTYNCHYDAADDFRTLTHAALSADFHASAHYIENFSTALAAAASNASVVLVLS